MVPAGKGRDLGETFAMTKGPGSGEWKKRSDLEQALAGVGLDSPALRECIGGFQGQSGKIPLCSYAGPPLPRVSPGWKCLCDR